MAERRCPLRVQGRGVGGGRHVADRRVRPRGIEVVNPARNDGAGVVHREEQMLVEALIAQGLTEEEAFARKIAALEEFAALEIAANHDAVKFFEHAADIEGIVV